MTLGERLLMAIVVLLLMACGMLWYGARLLQESVKTQTASGPDVVNNPSANRLVYAGGKAGSDLNDP
jgi:hypothetical protein